MNGGLILAIVVLLVSEVLGQQPIHSPKQSDFDKQVLYLAQTFAKDRSWINATNLPMVIGRLKWMRDQGTHGDADYSAWVPDIERSLVTLGDAETINRMINEFQLNQGRGEDMLLMGGTEATLPYLAPLLRTGSDKLRGGGDVSWPSVRDSAAKIMLDILIESKVFPNDVKKWARRCRDEHNEMGVEPTGLAILRSEVQKWWDHNSAAVTAQKYQEATWLPSSSPPRAGTQIISPPLSPVQPQRPPQSKRVEAGESKAGMAREDNQTIWIVVLVMIAAVVGLFWLLLKQPAT